MGYKINTLKFVAFLYNNDNLISFLKEIRETMPFAGALENTLQNPNQESKRPLQWKLFLKKLSKEVKEGTKKWGALL